ncbi:sugar transferase [Enterocloster citroniae]|uniref:sugar transferase n=1 Tax=Enterocloster citroniae TaxID=358743 RepID=UPI001D14CE05|nr:sugar transferase [Enterocloster citroniae]
MNGQVFTLYKFRTMTDPKDRNGIILSDDVHFTPFGRKLRSSSLDELPELLNMLWGILQGFRWPELNPVMRFLYRLTIREPKTVRLGRLLECSVWPNLKNIKI